MTRFLREWALMTFAGAVLLAALAALLGLLAWVFIAGGFAAGLVAIFLLSAAFAAAMPDGFRP